MVLESRKSQKTLPVKGRLWWYWWDGIVSFGDYFGWYWLNPLWKFIKYMDKLRSVQIWMVRFSHFFAVIMVILCFFFVEWNIFVFSVRLWPYLPQVNSFQCSNIHLNHSGKTPPLSLFYFSTPIRPISSIPSFPIPALSFPSLSLPFPRE